MGRSLVQVILSEARRQERQARRRQRDIERERKAAEKLSQIERARLEVEEYENSLIVLLSMHKEEPRVVDWLAFASSLPYPTPSNLPHHQLIADVRSTLAPGLASDGGTERRASQAKDSETYAAALLEQREANEELLAMRNLARRVLSGCPESYLEALAEFEVHKELSEHGCKVTFAAHSATLLEARVQVSGTKAFPDEEKRLSASGKVTTKAIPKARSHELYQDYVCSCLLRTSRDLLGLLPVDAVLLTAEAELFDSSTGQSVVRPVLSVIVKREHLGGLNFSSIDPSDAVSALEHRGDFKATRKSGAFLAVEPLTAAEVQESSRANSGPLDALVLQARTLRAEVMSLFHEAESASSEDLQ